MKFVDFKSSLKNESPKNIYLFCGEDAYFRESGYNMLRNKFITEPTMNVANLSQEELKSSEQILQQLNGYPFLSEYRLVCARDFYPKAEVIKGLQNYFKNPSPNTIFVILNEKPSDTLKKQTNVTTVDCGFESASALVPWIIHTCKNRGVIISQSVANKICDYTLCDMSRISSETEKLIDYVLQGEIKDEHVELLVIKDSSYKLYELTDSLSKKEFSKTLVILNELIGKGNSEQYIYVSLFYHIRKLLHTAINIKKSNEELAKVLSEKSEFRVKILKEQAQRFKVSALKKAYDTLIEGDYLAKSGVSNITYSLYVAVFKIMIE